MFIGQRGQQIHDLQEFLGLHIHLIETMESLNDIIIPYPPVEITNSDYLDLTDEEKFSIMDPIAARDSQIDPRTAELPYLYPDDFEG